jgi:hypothetical protein
MLITKFIIYADFLSNHNISTDEQMSSGKSSFAPVCKDESPISIYNMNCFNQCPNAASEINVFVICIFREKHLRYSNIINAIGKMLVKYNVLATTRYFNVHMTVLYACEEIPRFSVI